MTCHSAALRGSEAKVWDPRLGCILVPRNVLRKKLNKQIGKLTRTRFTEGVAGDLTRVKARKL